MFRNTYHITCATVQRYVKKTKKRINLNFKKINSGKVQ